MTHWMFSYNVPIVMNNFFYFVAFVLLLVAVGFGIYAAKAFKRVEQYIPADPAFASAKVEAPAAMEETEEFVKVEEPVSEAVEAVEE